MSDSLQPLGLYPTRLLCPWNFPGKNTGVGCHFLLQGIFPTQGLNPGLLHCRQMLYHLSHQGSPKGKPVIYEKKSGGGMRVRIYCSKLWLSWPSQLLQLLCQYPHHFQCLLFFVLLFSSSVVSDCLRHH